MFSLILAPLGTKPVRTAFLVAGAALLVAGATLMAFAPFYANTGFVRAELQQEEAVANSSSSSNVATTMLAAYSSYANNSELIALTGVIVAPIGAALLAYGLSAKKTEENEKQAAPGTDPMQA